MWSYFSRDPTKDFQFEIGEKVAGFEDKSIWILSHGKKKGTGDPVSIFSFDVKNASESQVQTAKASLKRIKTLRHPNILTYLDGVETEKVIYFATEPVIPLETYLRDNDSEGHNNIAISWGLHQVVKGLSFLVNDCNLIHNNVIMASIFVDPAGEWKLGGVDYMYPAHGADSIPPIKILPLLERYNSPEKNSGRNVKADKWSADMWGLGCLIWEVFNGTLPRTAALKSPGKIPQSLIPNYCELVGANPKSRPNPAKVIESCRRPGGFMDNSFVESMLFLEEIQIKDQAEKNKFLSGLTPNLDSFPSAFCRSKILPLLLNAFEFGNAGASVMAPMLKIGKILDAEEYQKKIVPCVVKLFSSPDRATRVKLLQQIDQFVEHLQPATVNDKLFPNISSGFQDTNPMVRESTIKAIMHLAPKLNYKNLNEEVMKQFARLQAKDDQGGIRTNTTVCLGKIAGFINPAMRQKILSSAFMRAMKDPFPPARQAGILGVATTQNFYTLSEVASRLLPALCSMTRDPDKGVRDQAFKTIKGFLSKLEKVSEDPGLEQEFEREVTSASGSVSVSAAAGWAGWAVTGMTSLTSKIYSKGQSQPRPKGQGSDAPSKPSPTLSSQDSGSGVSGASVPVTSGGIKAHITVEDAEQGGGWDDDDDDDWGDMEETSKDEIIHVNPEPGSDGGGWDDDEDWGSLEDTQASRHTEEFVSTQGCGLATTDSYNWGQPGDQEDFFSSHSSSKPKSKSTTLSGDLKSKQSSSKSQRAPAKVSDGWNDDTWGDSETGANSFKLEESDADKAKRERAERQKQRQKELKEKREARKAGGAMKLGVKKPPSPDLFDLTGS